MCATIFRPPLTDLVQISHSANENDKTRNNVDTHNLNSDNKNKIINKKLSFKGSKNTVNKVVNASNSTTNTTTTTATVAATATATTITAQSNRATSKDGSKNTSGKRSSSNKRDVG